MSSSLEVARASWVRRRVSSCSWSSRAARSPGRDRWTRGSAPAARSRSCHPPRRSRCWTQRTGGHHFRTTAPTTTRVSRPRPASTPSPPARTPTHPPASSSSNGTRATRTQSPHSWRRRSTPSSTTRLKAPRVGRNRKPREAATASGTPSIHPPTNPWKSPSSRASSGRKAPCWRGWW